MGQPAGVGGEVAPAAQPAAASGPGAGAQAGAAFGAAAGALGKLGGGGPVSVSHSGEGFPFKDLVMGGLSIMKANLIPSLILVGPAFALIILGIILGFVSPMLSMVALLGNLYMLTLWITLPNYLIGVRKFQETGQAMGIGDLLSFADIVPKIKAMVCGALGNMVFGLGSFALYLQLENPAASPVDCIKLGYKFGIKNLVPVIILGFILGFVGMGFLLGAAIGMPIAICAHYLAYTIKKDELAALAAAEGINLG